MCAIVKGLLVAEATGKLYSRITNETAVNNVQFYEESKGSWIVTCKTGNRKSIEFNATDEQMLNDAHHEYLVNEILSLSNSKSQ